MTGSMKFATHEGWFDEQHRLTPSGEIAFDTIMEAVKDQWKTCPTCEHQYLGKDYICPSCRYGLVA